MTRPLIKIVNAETGEELERQMTVAEFDNYKIKDEMEAQKLKDLEQKAEARQAIADRLGLSIDELKLLLG